MRSASRTISGLVPLGAEDYGRADGPLDYTRRIMVRRRRLGWAGPGRRKPAPSMGALHAHAATPSRTRRWTRRRSWGWRWPGPAVSRGPASGAPGPRRSDRLPAGAIGREAARRARCGFRFKTCPSEARIMSWSRTVTVTVWSIWLTMDHRDLKLHPLLSVEQRQP
jgi:hypothetical protein